jgi:hypothetical protein
MDFNSFESCKTYYKIRVTEFEHLTNHCVLYEDEVNIKVQDNFYFNLHCNKEYINSLMFKHIKYYFENELINAGFIINSEGSVTKFEHKYEMKNDFNDVENMQVDNVIDTIETEFSNTMSDNLFLKRCQYLGISTKEYIEKFRSVIRNERDFTAFNRFERLLRSEIYINEKLTSLTILRF